MFSYGIDTLYEKWFWYGETLPSIGSSSKRSRIEKVCDKNEYDHLTDMINDSEDHFVDRLDELTKMLEEVDKLIYPDSNITKLSFLVRMCNLKARNGWSDNGFSQLLSLLGDVLPKENNILNSMYEAKKILRALGMEYKKIHVCPNDYIL